MPLRGGPRRRALDGASRDELLGGGAFEPAPGIWDEHPLHPEIAEVAAGSFREREPPRISGSGYVVKALEAALWALFSSGSFEEGCLRAANLGHDADTTAAIFGHLAGALLGAEAIPARWRERVFLHTEIAGLAERLDALDERLAAVSAGLGPPARPGRDAPPRPPGDGYWVRPGKVLAGPYPGGPDPDDTTARLEALVDFGMSVFVDLTEEGEGPPLHPYEAKLRAIGEQRRRRQTHLRFPVRDVDVPSVWLMRAILSAIDVAAEAGEVVFVHCWGGVGRTGTVAACLLVEDGATGPDALARLAELRAGTVRRVRSSPETPEQEDFVRAWRPSERRRAPGSGR